MNPYLSRAWRCGLIALTLLAATPVMALAQLAPVGGAITGKVVDAQGEVVLDAQVLVVGERRFSTKTDRWGYRFDHLPPASYSVEVTSPGFVTAAVESVEVWVGDSLRIDFTLKDGSPNAVSMTSMPIIDTTTAGAAYRLFDPPLLSLPLVGTLASIERLLPLESELVSTTSLFIDGAEVLPTTAVDFAIQRPAVARLASEIFESADLFGSRLDPRIRTLDSLQLMTRATTAEWHGNFGVRLTGDELAGRDQSGLPERFEQVRPSAAMLLPVGSRFRLFGGLANHRARAKPVDQGGNYESGALRGIQTTRADDTLFIRLDGGPFGPNLDLRASFLQIDSDEHSRRGDDPTFARLDTSVERSVARVSRFSGRIGTLAQFTERRAETALVDSRTREIETRDIALSVDTLISRHYLVLGASREATTGDVLAPPLDLASAPPVGALPDLGLEHTSVHLSDRWRATRNIALQLGVRGERLTWTQPSPSPGQQMVRENLRETWWLPRVGAAWDVFGNGEFALLLSGGEELVRQVSIFDSGLKPLIDRSLPPTDRVVVQALSISTRYQLFPGLIVESELGRRRFSGDREDVIRPLAEEERRVRFGAEARISKRWQARTLFELRDLGPVLPGADQTASPVELGTTQRTHLHLVRRWDSGWVTSGVFEYVDDYNVAMRSLGIVSQVPAEEVGRRSSLAQLDLLIEYRWRDFPKIAFLGNSPELVWRLEVLNVLDRRTRPVAIPEAFLGPGIEGLFPYPTLSSDGLATVASSGALVSATQQQGRRIWLGFGLEL